MRAERRDVQMSQNEVWSELIAVVHLFQLGFVLVMDL